MFDKIQNQMLEIEPNIKNGLEFIMDCVQPFKIQVEFIMFLM